MDQAAIQEVLVFLSQAEHIQFVKAADDANYLWLKLKRCCAWLS